MKRLGLISVIIFIICIPFLIYVLAGQHEGLPVYILYAVSALSLTGTVWALVCALRTFRLPGLRLPEDRLTRKKLTLRLSLASGLCYGIFKLALGLYIPSLWLCLMAFYYFALSLCRFYIVRHYQEGWQLCFRTGSRLLVFNIFASAIITYVTIREHEITYPGFAIYAIAAWTFYSLSAAVIDLVRSGKTGNASLISAGAVKMSGALVSMFILQTAMITTFGADDYSFRRVMSSAFGFFVSVFILLAAILLMLKGRRGAAAPSSDSRT